MSLVQNHAEVGFMIGILNSDMPTSIHDSAVYIEKKMRDAGFDCEVSRKTGEIVMKKDRLVVFALDDTTFYCRMVKSDDLRSIPLNVSGIANMFDEKDLPPFPSLLVPRSWRFNRETEQIDVRFTKRN